MFRRISAPRPGPTGVIPGAEPFSFYPESVGPAPRSPKGGVGCLLVHGFTSTPYDVRGLGEHLAQHGIASEGILLRGHGTCPEDLAATGLAHWLRSVRDGYERLARRCDSVFALGISLSGNFVLTLAPLLPFAGLILVGTPLKFRHERAYRAAYRTLRALGKEYQKKWYLEHLDPVIRARRPTYDHFPLKCAPDCLAAVHWSRISLAKVRCPVLILQSTTDHAVDEQTVTEFRTHLASPDIAVRFFPDRYHVLIIDHGSEEVFDAIREFIQTRTPAFATAPAATRATAPQLAAQPAGFPS